MGVRIMTGYLIGAAVIVVLLVFWEIWRELHRFIITEYEIESPKFEVNMEISIKHGDASKMELNGCYCNALQIIRRADNPFDVVEGGDESWVSGEPVEKELGTDPILDEADNLPF